MSSRVSKAHKRRISRASVHAPSAQAKREHKRKRDRENVLAFAIDSASRNARENSRDAPKAQEKRSSRVVLVRLKTPRCVSCALCSHEIRHPCAFIYSLARKCERSKRSVSCVSKDTLAPNIGVDRHLCLISLAREIQR